MICSRCHQQHNRSGQRYCGKCHAEAQHPRAIPICAKCNRENDRGEQRYCTKCHAAYMREWRKTHPLSGESKKRDINRSYAGEYRRRDHLKPEPCRVCGDSKAEMHHPDHELPLMVVWLCRKCHLSWHAFWRSVALDAWNFWQEKARADTAKPADQKQKRAA